jgi:hypothetical protein
MNKQNRQCGNLKHIGNALLVEKNFFLLIFCLSLSICFAVDVELKHEMSVALPFKKP